MSERALIALRYPTALLSKYLEPSVEEAASSAYAPRPTPLRSSEAATESRGASLDSYSKSDSMPLLR